MAEITPCLRGDRQIKGYGIWTSEQLGNENPGGTFHYASPEERSIALSVKTFKRELHFK